MSSIDKLLNAPVMVTFDLGNEEKKEFEFREFTTLQNSKYRAKLLNIARTEWLTRVRYISGTIGHELERRKYLVEAAHHEPDWEPDIARLSTTLDGFKWAMQLVAVPELTDKDFERLNELPSNADSIIRAMTTILGIPIGELQKKEDQGGQPQTVAEDKGTPENPQTAKP